MNQIFLGLEEKEYILFCRLFRAGVHYFVSAYSL